MKLIILPTLRFILVAFSYVIYLPICFIYYALFYMWMVLWTASFTKYNLWFMYDGDYFYKHHPYYDAEATWIYKTGLDCILDRKTHLKK